MAVVTMPGGGSTWARAKSATGIAKTLPILPAVGTPEVDPNYSVFTVGGTTAITAFGTRSTPILPGRNVILIGTDVTGPAFTDTAIASAANGTISLGSALTLANGTVVEFVQTNNGAWLEVGRSANG